MVRWRQCANPEIPSDRKLQFLLLLIVGVIEFLFISTEGMFEYVGYYFVENYIMVPCLIFLGASLMRELSRSAKFSLCLSSAAVLWLVITQMQHKMQGIGYSPVSFFFLSYLMAFPFASVTEDGEKNMGLRWLGKLFVAASLVLVVYTALLVLECVPAFLVPFLYWDGPRLHVLWHPNTAASIFMIGIGICMYFFFQKGTRVQKLFLAGAAAVQFMAMALTNCRTSILITCAFVGGAVFFALQKGGWKRFVAGLAAALLVMAALFLTSSKLYDLNTEALEAKLAAQMQEPQAELERRASSASAIPAPEATTVTETEGESQTDTVDGETEDITLQGQNEQKSLLEDLWTLNGRTLIWNALRQAMRDDPSLKKWGTEYVGIILSAYNPFPVEHAHNSWLEMMMRLGLTGLLFALAFTGIAVWSAAVLLWKRTVAIEKKIISMLVLCLLVTGFLEPYLFVTKSYYHFIDFMFFFLVGYLDQWRRQALRTADAG